MTDKYSDLESLFVSNPSSAIEKSQQIICSVTEFGSYKDFYNYHLEHPHISTCQKEWAKPQMAIHCIDCSNSPQSCFCLQCFLNGQHPGHEYLIRPESTGNCDCGDLSLWKRSGFCPLHYGLDDDSHPEDYLDEKLRTTLTDIVFKAAFSSLKHLTHDEDERLPLIVQFLISFLKFGDGFRRLIVISLTDKIDFQGLFNCIVEASQEFNDNLQQFLGLLINDQIFKLKFSTVNYKFMSEMVPELLDKEIDTGEPNANLKIWRSFWFHSYCYPLYKYNIEQLQWDWVDFGIQMLKIAKEPLRIISKPKYLAYYPDILINVLDLKEASQVQPQEQTQKLFDRLFTEILNCGTTQGIQNGTNDTIIVSSFKDRSEEYSYVIFLMFNYTFYQIIDCFKSKKDLKFDTMFEELDKTIDITEIYQIGLNTVETSPSKENENDKFFVRYFNSNRPSENVNNDHYKSFHNGASFNFSHLMFYTAAYLIRSDSFNRQKIAHFLQTEKYQPLRVKLGIVALKSLMAMICFHQSLVPRNNFAVSTVFSKYINDPQLVDFGIPLLFPFFQLLIGVKSDSKNDYMLKEFFAFEMSREIGLFDDMLNGEDYKDDKNTIEIQKQMTFTFLYVTILLIVERTLFNFDSYKFIKEQIVFGLKRGLNRLNELEDMFNRNIATPGRYMADLNKIVYEVATARQHRSSSNDADSSAEMGSGDADVTFDLKSDTEFKYFSAINSFNELKVLMNNKIKKNPDVLINVPKFEPEESYFFKEDEAVSVSLKEFLMTPTVLAVIYHTLRTNNEVELNDHLAMNVLLLISKFLNENDGSNNDNSIKQNEVVHYDSSIVDLISKLKRLAFNYKEDENSNATIENTLTTKASFKSLLSIKMSPNEQEPKSFIDLLLEKGELGKSVIDQMSIEIKIEGVDNQKEKEDLKKMKKVRANKLKQEIMSHYKQITANFNVNDERFDDQLDPENNSSSITSDKDVCSICSTSKSKEILSFPLYIYRTKFPFIVDKPPLVSLKACDSLNEIDVIGDHDFGVQKQTGEEEEEKKENDGENDDEDDDELKVDIIFSQYLSDHPELEIADDMAAEAREQLLTVHTIIRQAIADQLDEVKQQREEAKKEEAQRKQILKKKKEALKREKELMKNSESIVVKRLTAGNPFVIQFGICQHPVHHRCVSQENSYFTCPIDRTFKNGLLPSISELSSEFIFKDGNEGDLSDQLKESLEYFISKYALFFDDSENDVFVELIKSLSGIISTYEIRLRNLPDCLDSKKTILLSRNLFLATWYAYRMRGKPEMRSGFNSNPSSEKVDERLTVFQKFVKKLIECDEIEKSKIKSLNDIVSSFVAENHFNNEKEICLFLRRVCLSDHFLLRSTEIDQGPFKLIDWDEVLSASNLSKLYGVTFKTLKSEDDEFEFKPFTFSKLPKEFLRFSQKPFNFPVDQTQIVSLFNLLDYNQLIINYSEDDSVGEVEKVPTEEEIERYKSQLGIITRSKDFIPYLHLNYSSKNCPIVLIFVGLYASNVIVIDGRKLAKMRPFYLDKYGCQDIGYKRNQPLFLNDERYDRFMDEFLSGDFSNDLVPL